MIDSAQLRRLLEQTCPGQVFCIGGDTLKIAQAIYRAGMEDMLERAAHVCKDLSVEERAASACDDIQQKTTA